MILMKVKKSLFNNNNIIIFNNKIISIILIYNLNKNIVII